MPGVEEDTTAFPDNFIFPLTYTYELSHSLKLSMVSSVLEGVSYTAQIYLSGPFLLCGN